jgi:FemAB-related protein (PEP-CTERM system-associated)
MSAAVTTFHPPPSAAALRVRPAPKAPSTVPPTVDLLPRDRGAEWDDYVAGHPDATLYHLHAWREIAERAFGIATAFLVSRDAAGGPPRGVLPLFRVPRPGAPYFTTGLFGAYGRLLADDVAHERALLGAAIRRIDRREAAYLHLKLLGGVPADLPLRRHDEWVVVRRPLEETEDRIFQGLSSGMRNKIRHAQRAGLTPHRGQGDLGVFYDVLSANMHRKGAPIYGRRFFEVLLASLGDRADVVTLRHQGRVVSGALVVRTHGTAYVPFSSSLPEAFPLRANNLLWWEIQRMARADGAHTLDFGSSLRGSTGLDFKTGWRGAQVEPIGSYLYAGGGPEPVLVPKDSPIARLGVRVLAWLPRVLYEAAGPRICRWIA